MGKLFETPLHLERLPGEFTIVRLAAHAALPDWCKSSDNTPFICITRSDRELSIVAPASSVPDDREIAAEPGWRGLRIAGRLDFSLVGILARLSSALAEADIPIFAVSTFETDYLFVKAHDYSRALEALRLIATID